jgi:two-component sensor histidine kinase
VGTKPRYPSDRETELSAEVARLHTLLQQAAVDARTAADEAATDVEMYRVNSAAAEIKHAQELAEERAKTAAAHADTRAATAKARSDADASRVKAAATEARHTQELDHERARTVAARINADELQHRIKNTFATIQAIANATLRDDVSYADARAAFNGRLMALAQVQDLLFERNWRGTNLKSLVDGILIPHAGNGSKRFRVKGTDIDIGPKTALVFGLALNELATNALKYGALSNRAGYIEINWTQEPDFRLRWHERGGPPVAVPLRKGFGSRLIRDSLAAQLHGTVELEFKQRGLICTISASVDKLLP